MNLIYPDGYKKLTPEQIARNCNGCGTRGWGWIVPQKFWLLGINFRPACNLHDLSYALRIPKTQSDSDFLSNLQTIVDEECVWLLKPIGYYFAFMFYLAVKNGGAGAYQRAALIAKIDSENSFNNWC